MKSVNKEPWKISSGKDVSELQKIEKSTYPEIV